MRYSKIFLILAGLTAINGYTPQVEASKMADPRDEVMSTNFQRLQNQDQMRFVLSTIRNMSVDVYNLLLVVIGEFLSTSSLSDDDVKKVEKYIKDLDAIIANGNSKDILVTALTLAENFNIRVDFLKVRADLLKKGQTFMTRLGNRSAKALNEILNLTFFQRISNISKEDMLKSTIEKKNEIKDQLNSDSMNMDLMSMKRSLSPVLSNNISSEPEEDMSLSARDMEQESEALKILRSPIELQKLIDQQNNPLFKDILIGVYDLQQILFTMQNISQKLNDQDISKKVQDVTDYFLDSACGTIEKMTQTANEAELELWEVTSGFDLIPGTIKRVRELIESREELNKVLPDIKKIEEQIEPIIIMHNNLNNLGEITKIEQLKEAVKLIKNSQDERAKTLLGSLRSYIYDLAAEKGTTAADDFIEQLLNAIKKEQAADLRTTILKVMEDNSVKTWEQPIKSLKEGQKILGFTKTSALTIEKFRQLGVDFSI